MFDIALGSAGATVSLASSSDSKFAPENIIDGKSDTFWLTTGMFPQEFVVTFASAMTVNSVKLTCHNVRRLALEKSTKVSKLFKLSVITINYLIINDDDYFNYR